MQRAPVYSTDVILFIFNFNYSHFALNFSSNCCRQQNSLLLLDLVYEEVDLMQIYRAYI